MENICGNCNFYMAAPLGLCAKSRLVDGMYWTPQGFVSRVMMLVIPEFGCNKFELHEAIAAGNRPAVTAEWRSKENRSAEYPDYIASEAERTENDKTASS